MTEPAAGAVRMALVVGSDVTGVWADGHDHGIYLLADLRRARGCEQCAAGRVVPPSGEAP